MVFWFYVTMLKFCAMVLMFCVIAHILSSNSFLFSCMMSTLSSTFLPSTTTTSSLIYFLSSLLFFVSSLNFSWLATRALMSFSNFSSLFFNSDIAWVLLCECVYLEVYFGLWRNKRQLMSLK